MLSACLTLPQSESRLAVIASSNRMICHRHNGTSPHMLRFFSSQRSRVVDDRSDGRDCGICGLTPDPHDGRPA